MKVSIKDISKRTGFSPATISNALNHKRGVNEETAAEVFRVAKEIGYISESKIMRVKLVIFKNNGKIIDDTPFFSLLFDGIEKECRAAGMEMVLCSLNKEDEDYEEQVDWIIHDNTCAVILLGTELMEEDVELYKSASCPFLMLDYWAWDMSFHGVLINNADSARLAVEYLIKKGHREIGYLKGDYRIKAFRSREVGYGVAMQKRGLPVKKEYMVTLSTTMNGAYRDMLKYLQGFPKLPTAYFADNDMIALGAMKALQEMNYRIPEDVSVVGFDDLPFSEISNPPLTTLRVPKQEMGRIAVKKLVEVLNGDMKVKTKTQVCTVFVERNSVKQMKE
ncbi:MAG: LacI family transcriptional regulator [Lachnospiraceae bacterium]|nr:LacI family transcriptional regulator [Lachnospiraceae bacterium]MCI9343171.1 LacI family transcriptional regulator [Lachnospiraceae bacterium]GFH89937.1 ribose operon repressor [Lachnospiraceae bacterium]